MEGNRKIFAGPDSETPRSSGLNLSKRLRTKNPDRKENPFEKDLLRKLNQSLWSPSVLHSSAISQTPPTFDWSIDDISKLNPVKIEESPSSHNFTEEFSLESEVKAQAQISHFFTNTILPSPIGVPLTMGLSKNSSTEDEMDFSRQLHFTFEDSTTEMEDDQISPFQHHGAYIASPSTDFHNAPHSLIKVLSPPSNNSSGSEEMIVCSTPNST